MNINEQKKIKPGVIWFTGLPASGKSSIAKELEKLLLTLNMQVVVLDGDEIRNLLRNDKFDKDSRILHNRYVAHTASVVEKLGGIAVVCLISPLQISRDFARSICSNYYEVFVNTPQSICQNRDPKKLYKKAIDGTVAEFTGISSEFEIPKNPEIVVSTERDSVETIAKVILNNYLIKKNE